MLCMQCSVQAPIALVVEKEIQEESAKEREPDLVFSSMYVRHGTA